MLPGSQDLCVPSAEDALPAPFARPSERQQNLEPRPDHHRIAVEHLAADPASVELLDLAE